LQFESSWGWVATGDYSWDLTCSNFRLIVWFIFLALAWTLWNIRNKLSNYGRHLNFQTVHATMEDADEVEV
jgi:hypothetical protein